MEKNIENKNNYKKFLEKNYRTGKTTRMAIKAKNLVQENKNVNVIVHNKSMETIVRELIGKDFLLKNKNKIKIRIACDLQNFDWEQMRDRGQSKPIEYLFDHYLLEIKFSKIFDKWLDSFEIED